MGREREKQKRRNKKPISQILSLRCVSTLPFSGPAAHKSASSIALSKAVAVVLFTLNATATP